MVDGGLGTAIRRIYMKKLGYIVPVILVLAAMLLQAGCASYMSYESSKAEIIRNRVYASGSQKGIQMLNRGYDEETAIRAIALENGGVGIGVDVGSWQVLSQHPWRQFGAALLDAAMVYGGYRGVEALNDSGSGGDSNTAGRDNNTINVNGNGNDVHVGDETTTSTETPVVVTE